MIEIKLDHLSVDWILFDDSGVCYLLPFEHYFDFDQPCFLSLQGQYPQVSLKGSHGFLLYSLCRIVDTVKSDILLSFFGRGSTDYRFLSVLLSHPTP